MCNILINTQAENSSRSLFFIDKVLRSHQQLNQILSEDIVWLSTTDADWREYLIEAKKYSSLIAILTNKIDQNEMQTAMLLGARAYCHVLSSSKLLEAVSQALTSGGLWIPKEFVGKVVTQISQSDVFVRNESSASMLTAREREVLDLILMGHSNLEISSELAIKERTVKEHVGAILRKYEVKDRVALLLKIGKFSI